jgi:hypothetical protein
MSALMALTNNSLTPPVRLAGEAASADATTSMIELLRRFFKNSEERNVGSYVGLIT